MAVSPGDEVYADDILSRFRVGTGYEDTDSATFTTSNTVIATAVASLVSGRTYHVRLITHIASTVAADTVNLTIREDSVSGTEVQGSANVLTSTSTAGAYAQLSGDYTAVATGSKTFVGVAARAGGTGNLRREAAGIRPTFLTVDYAYGA